MYSDIVMDHFNNPRNTGVIEDADGIGEVGNPVCGDMMTFYIKVKDNRLEDVKFQTFGCVAAIAVSSMVSEMAKGKDLEEAKKITNKQVAETLGGLPPNKLHCSNLGAEALTPGHQELSGEKADEILRMINNAAGRYAPAPSAQHEGALIRQHTSLRRPPAHRPLIAFAIDSFPWRFSNPLNPPFSKGDFISNSL